MNYGISIKHSVLAGGGEDKCREENCGVHFLPVATQHIQM